MKLNVARVDVWIASLKDAPGMLSEKMRLLSDAGVALDFVFARRSPERPGKGVAFVAPIQGAAKVKAAKKAGFKKSKRLSVLKVTGADRSGMGAAITEAIAAAGISIQGFSVHVIGNTFALHLAFDRAASATKAAGIIKKL
jgi:predicted amino acid-binding ACT domain protein